MTGLRRLLFWLILLVVVAIIIILPLNRRWRSTVASSAPGIARRGTISDRLGRELAFDDTSGETRVRRYPAGETLAPLIGLIGKAGLEYSLDSILKPRRRATGSYVAGQDVSLTIDLDVQRAVFRRLKAGVEACRARLGSVVVLDAQSGQIRALAEYPSFDPQKYKLYPPEVWRCHAVNDDMEPGPAFQVATAMALPADLNPGDALTAFLADTSFLRRIDPGLLRDAADRLGLGSRTGIELPAEATGALPDENEMRAHPDLFFRAAQGQGIGVSLIQLAQAWCRIADRTKRRPFVVFQVKDLGKVIYDHEADRLAPVFKDSALLRIKGLLASSTSPIPVYGAGGIAPQAGVANRDSSTMLVFAGFAQSEPVRFVVALMIDRPLVAYYTQDTAFQLFRSIIQVLP